MGRAGFCVFVGLWYVCVKGYRNVSGICGFNVDWGLDTEGYVIVVEQWSRVMLKWLMNVQQDM